MHMLMRRFSWLASLLAVFSITSAVVGATPPEFGTSPLAIEGDAGRHEFEVELAITPEQRQWGLMFRDHLADDQGMLFDFEKMQPVTMWMRNTLISLDMLFIDDEGRIRRIAAETTPLSDATIPSGEPVRAVLELRGGRAAELGIRAGDRVIHPLFDD
jgi:uncharacterized membrane protein (UPF0127 family)